MKMSFSDLFKTLPPARLDSAAYSFARRNQTGPERRGIKRKGGGGQHHQKDAGGGQHHQKDAGGGQHHQKKCRRLQTNTSHKPFKHEEDGWRRRQPAAGPERRETNQQKKKKYPHQPNRGPAYRTGGRGRIREDNRTSSADRTRFMTQDFMEQNVVQVDGRLLCKHFLLGRCVKGEECQLEHAQAHNDLFKDCCKFYIQGFCMKGDACPFMHKSVPCKFFHRQARCSQGESCRFSHEPLTEVTKKVLDTLIKRGEEQLELARRKEAPGQPEEPKPAETEPVLEQLLQPVRLSFYNSENAETLKEADMKEAAPPPAPPCQQTGSRAVCYSVEAVLGPQLSRLFPPLLPASTHRESPPPEAARPAQLTLTSSDSPQEEKSPVSQTTPSPPVTSDLRDQLISSGHSEKLNKRHEANKSLEKVYRCLPSVRGHAGVLPAAGRPAETQSQDLSLKAAHSSSPEVPAVLLEPPHRRVAESPVVPVRRPASSTEPPAGPGLTESQQVSRHPPHLRLPPQTSESSWRRSPQVQKKFSEAFLDRAAAACPGDRAPKPDQSSSRSFLRLFRAPPQSEDQLLRSSDSQRPGPVQLLSSPGNSPEPLEDLESKAAPGDSCPAPASTGAAADSVLKTLFVCLSPFEEEERGQSSVHVLDGGSTPTCRKSASRRPAAGTGLTGPESKGKERIRQQRTSENKSSGSDRTKASAPPAGHELQDASLPVQSRGRVEEEEGKRRRRSFTPVVSSLKGLFQALDTSVFHSGL